MVVAPQPSVAMPLSVGPTMPGMPAAATSGGPNGAGGDYHATLYQRWLRGEISDDAVRGLAGEELYAVFVMQRMEEQGGRRRAGLGGGPVDVEDSGVTEADTQDAT